jgi:branched-chain amino acid transport system ATP-binding protein
VTATRPSVGDAGPLPVLEVVGLTVHHGGLCAVDAVSLEMAAGEVVGLIGPNGAGKTTLIDAVCGYTPARSGVVRLGGVDVGGLAPHRRARLGLARTFQSLELFDDLTVAENLAVAAHARGLASVVADLAGPRHSAVGSGGEIADALSLVGLDGYGERTPSGLSNGERHLVALARALVASPAVVCLDEPAAGLDPLETAVLAGVVRAVADAGAGVLLVDHDMDLVLGACDRVVVLDFGRRIAVGPPATVRRDPLVLEAYLGTVPADSSTSADPILPDGEAQQ